MKNNITLYLVVVLVIVSLNFNECLTDNSRSKRSVKLLGGQEIHEDQENLETSNLKKNYNNIEQNLLREKRDREDRDTLKRQAELQVTKTELAELQRKIENEIVGLKNRYKKSRTGRQDDDSKLIANPRLVKIEVDTYEIDSPRQSEHHNQNIQKREDADDRINIKISGSNDNNEGSSGSIKRRMITFNDKGLVKSSEEDIERKIEALKKSVRDEIYLKKRSNEVEKSNLKDEMKNVATNKCPFSNDVHKKVIKRSASFERKNKSKKKSVVKKRKKSVTKNNSIKSNGVDSNVISSKSKIKSSLRGIRKTSHHDKPKHNKHSLHKNKYENKRDKVVKKRVSNKNIKHKLSANDLDRRKRNKHASKKVKPHVRIAKAKDKHKHQHKKHYKRWDVVEREGRSVEAVENKNSNAEAESDDGLDVLNSQDNKQIASEYKEAFGGFPNDPADSFTRYKRIKRYKS